MTNETVFREARATLLSTRVLAQQLLYFGRAARLQTNAIVKQYLFKDHALQQRQWPGPKRRGCPRSNWVERVHAEALE